MSFWNIWDNGSSRGVRCLSALFPIRPADYVSADCQVYLLDIVAVAITGGKLVVERTGCNGGGYRVQQARGGGGGIISWQMGAGGSYGC